MNKTGEAFSSENLLRAIAYVFFIIVVVALIYKASGVLFLKSEVQICRASAIARDATGVADTEPPIDLECPRHYITFFEDHVERDGATIPIKVATKQEGTVRIGGEDSNYALTYGVLDNEMVNYVIAEEVKECWYKLGEGNLDIFGADVYDAWGHSCVVCSQVSFDESITGTFSGFETYAKTQHAVGMIEDEKIFVEQKTYYEYIVEGLPENQKQPRFLPQGQEEIDSQKTYAVTFVQIKPQTFVGALQKLLDWFKKTNREDYFLEDFYLVVVSPLEYLSIEQDFWGRNVCDYTEN